jgi:hypothetical protein
MLIKQKEPRNITQYCVQGWFLISDCLVFRLEKPSVPLKATGDPGPPRIVEIQEKYSAVEGRSIILS